MVLMGYRSWNLHVLLARNLLRIGVRLDPGCTGTAGFCYKRMINQDFSVEARAMTRRTGGFTLIELIVVIAILGILAAVALPKFAALQADARIAKMNGALGSIKAGASLARSIQLTQGLGPNTSVNMEGQVVNMVNGYPTAASIAVAAGIATPDFFIGAVSPGGGPGLPAAITIGSDGNHTLCAVTFTEATTSSAPIYSVALNPTNITDRTNCE